MGQPEGLKLKTARTLKWNLVDRLGSQVLYGITGVVLAWKLSPDDFGLIGAILIFQAFGSLLVDSGFSHALLQRKQPTRLDYSSVLWFNMAVAIVLYALLWVLAPWISTLFNAGDRLVALSRAMFVILPLNAAAIVQTSLFMKQMNVRPVAMANIVSLTLGGGAGIALACMGFGAWALVWQAIVNAMAKTAILWSTSRWLPLGRMSWKALSSFFKVGGGMMFTSFLNTVFLNLYSFLIGNRVGLVPLGYYTQADKWSKMGVMSLSQVLTSTFLPVLSSVQDDEQRYNRLCLKMNRMTAYLAFPLMVGLIVLAQPIFHVLFGTKWDASVILFQLLLLRGVFTVFTQLYNNYLLALGHSGVIARLEVWRDVIAVIGLVVTFPVMAVSLPDNPVYGLTLMLWGQVAAGAAGWIMSLFAVQRRCGVNRIALLRGYAPYIAMTLMLSAAMTGAGTVLDGAWMRLIVEAVIGAGGYILANHLLHSTIQKDAIAYLRGKL